MSQKLLYLEGVSAPTPFAGNVSNLLRATDVWKRDYSTVLPDSYTSQHGIAMPDVRGPTLISLILVSVASLIIDFCQHANSMFTVYPLKRNKASLVQIQSCLLTNEREAMG